MALPKTRAEEDEEKARAARAEGDDEPGEKPDAEDKPEDVGTEPSGKCSGCGMANDENAKFCDQCGASMAAPRVGDDDEDPPPSSKPKPGEAARVMAPKAMSTEASLAAILGATSESLPALKTAAIGLRQISDTAAGVTGKTRPREIVGALLAVPEQLAEGKRAAADLATRAKAEEKKERWDLAHRLNKLGLAGRSRSSIFLDEVDGKTGARKAVKLQPEYARMDLDVFRGIVTSHEANAPAVKRTPFEASREAAEAAAKEAQGIPNGKPTAAQIERAKSEPAVLRMFNHPNNKFPIERIAEQFLLSAVSAGGVQ